SAVTRSLHAARTIYRDHVGHEGAAEHMRSDADVRERGRADLHSVRLVAAIGDEVVAELPEGVLGVAVDLALGQGQIYCHAENPRSEEHTSELQSREK